MRVRGYAVIGVIIYFGLGLVEIIFFIIFRVFLFFFGWICEVFGKLVVVVFYFKEGGEVIFIYSLVRVLG